MGLATGLFFVTLITCCTQIFVCLIFVGQVTQENLSSTKIPMFMVLLVITNYLEWQMVNLFIAFIFVLHTGMGATQGLK